MKLEKVTESRRWYDDACGTALALEFVGERWSLLIMREPMFGARRFGEIKANLPGISANVLTQRLESMEAAGILVRRRLPSPANVQVYELTRWGLEAEVMVQEMGRWATRSRRHDPMLFFSPASAMMSLRTMVDRDRAAGLAMTLGFRFPADTFVGRLEGGTLAVARGEAEADSTFTGDTMAFRRTIYGKLPLGDEDGLSVEGDQAAAQRFVDLFALPEKIA
jgi:DNA-binding HxlR family transcriptional regulator